MNYVGQVQNLIETAGPIEEPITLAQAKLHCKVDYDDDDGLINDLITTAREKCEAEVHRAFVSRDYELRLNGFPFANGAGAANYERLPNLTAGLIKVPKPPLLAVHSIQYVDNDGVLQTIDPSLYQVEGGGKLQGVIAPAYGLTWPVARYQLSSVRIALTAGYGPSAALPRSVGRAMLLLVGHLWRNREAASSTSMVELPFGVQSILSTLQWGSYG